ncbi:Na+/H+ antiporter NhaC family protein [Clostridium oceanicum]|uniref:Na+/H+ antiporter NhaC family protein n=1 Tax=Clostridium oceanicum TaxID=1543 RepID=A0ABN1JTF6_9CLOT
MNNMGILSLLPPIIAIIIAVKTKNVILSLFISVFVGVFVVVGYLPGFAVTTMIKDYFFVQLMDSYNAGVLVLLVFIGGFVSLMEKSGGAIAFAEKTSKFINTRVKAQIAAWLGGLLIFFSDLGTPLIIGPIFEPIFDKLKISREKLAFIIDSTASPVCVLVPFIGWGVYVMGLIQKEFDALKIGESDWSAFLHAVPFQFYSILALIIVPIIAFSGFEFSSMAKAEKRTQETGKIFWPDSKPLRQKDYSDKINYNKSKAILVWFPILILLATLLVLLVPKGFPFKKIAGSEFRVALSTGYLFSGISLIAMMVYYKVKKFSEAFDIYIGGMKKMMNVSIILVLSWSLGLVLKNLGTANYVIQIAEGNIPGFLIPAIIFIAGGCTSFATGSSWGTFAILMPLAIPMANSLNAPLYVTIAAVLSGGLFGDQLSPISDTTILASTGAGCDHIDHVKTQMSYGIINGSASFITYIIAGIFPSVITLLVAVIIMIIILYFGAKFKGCRIPNTSINTKNK